MILDESRADSYWLHEPEQVEQIAIDLAAMAFHGSGRDPQQAVPFVRRYGLLWHGPDELDSGSFREPLDDWWHEAEKLSTLLLTSVRLGKAMCEGSTLPIRKHLEALGILFEADET